MKVLFAVNNDKISESIIRRYQKTIKRLYQVKMYIISMLY